MTLDETNRQVNEAREEQRTKDQENEPVTSDVRGKPTEHIWKPSQESVVYNKGGSIITSVTNRSFTMKTENWFGNLKTIANFDKNSLVEWWLSWRKPNFSKFKEK